MLCRSEKFKINNVNTDILLSGLIQQLDASKDINSWFGVLGMLVIFNDALEKIYPLPCIYKTDEAFAEEFRDLRARKEYPSTYRLQVEKYTPGNFLPTFL